MTAIKHGELWEVLINNSVVHKEGTLYLMQIIDLTDDTDIILSEPTSPIRPMTYRFKKEDVQFINKIVLRVE